MTDQDHAFEAGLARHDPLGEPDSSGNGLNPGLLNGPEGPRMGANVQRNMDEGRICLAMGVFERPWPLVAPKLPDFCCGPGPQGGGCPL